MDESTEYIKGYFQCSLVPQFQQYVITEMAKHARKQKRENCSKIVRRDVSVKLEYLLLSFLKAYGAFRKEQLWLV